jgi:hypothetical protein
VRLRALRPALALVAILAFAATSRAPRRFTFNVSAEYPFRVDRAKLLERLQLGASDPSSHYAEHGYLVQRTDLGSAKDLVVLSVNGECRMTIEAELHDRPGGGSVLRLRESAAYCLEAENADPEPYVRSFFERNVLSHVPGSGFDTDEKKAPPPPPAAPAPPAPAPDDRDRGLDR